MAALVATTTLAFSSMLLQQGCRKQDECERAFARLERIAAKHGEPKASEQGKSLVMQECRGGKGSWDPVLRCAIDSASDDEADACIQRGLKDVVRPSNDDSGGGKGLNPLIEQ
jgi:cytochrome c551/c552